MSTPSYMVQIIGGLAVIMGVLAVGAWAAGNPGYRGPFGFGRVPSEAEIRASDIAVAPDGQGLPPGRGTVSAGERGVDPLIMLLRRARRPSTHSGRPEPVEERVVARHQYASDIKNGGRHDTRGSLRPVSIYRLFSSESP